MHDKIGDTEPLPLRITKAITSTVTGLAVLAFAAYVLQLFFGSR